MGLTGGVASGKSTVVRLLAGLGAATCDADALVEALYRPESPGTKAVLELFGPGVLDGDGGVDRRALGRLVFDDPAARRRLESAIHPQVRAGVAAWFEGLRRSGEPPAVAVVEAALLVEVGAHVDYDRLAVVLAPEASRRARAIAAGWPAVRFDAVAAAQTGDGERIAVADYVIRNDGAPDALAGVARTLWTLLCEDAARLSEGLPLLARRLELP